MESPSPSRQLLLLDDDVNVLKSLTRVLQTDGYQIHAFSRPLDALHLLESQSVEVIVSDLCMPQMDGREFLRRAAALSPDSVLITLSGYVEEDQVLAGGEGGAWRTLSKPWCDAELKRAVAEAFLSLPLHPAVRSLRLHG